MCGFLLLTLVATGGCVERKLVITSEPSGALVTVNQTWSGYTPFTLDFKHHGTYDIRLEKEGYYPLFAKEPIAAPLYQQPGIDIISEVAPANIRNVYKVHYKMERIGDPDDIEGVLGRRDEMKSHAERASELRKERDKDRMTVPLPLPTKAKEGGDEETEKPDPAAETTEKPSGTVKAIIPSEPTEPEVVQPESAAGFNGPELE